jgi:hypothetical protein
MMKPKHALVKDGFLPAGSENKKGRLSGAAIERCKELASTGWEIEGYSVSDTPDSSGAAVVEKVKVVTGEKTIADIGNPARDESMWEAYANVNGKIVPVGMRTVDNSCGNSLTYCFCRTPVVNVDYDAVAVVNFKPRKG